MEKLYWTERGKRPGIIHGAGVPKSELREGGEVLREFISQCQRNWIASNGSVNGRYMARKRYIANANKGLKRRTARVCPFKGLRERWLRNGRLEGNTYIAGEHSEGNYLMVARIGTSELIESMRPGGEFEDLNAKGLIVLIYTLWEDSARFKLAKVFGIKDKNHITCDLMGDIRLLRNIIVHRSDKARREYQRKAEVLPRLWGPIGTADLVLTDGMVYELMGELNCIQVDVPESG